MRYTSLQKTVKDNGHFKAPQPKMSIAESAASPAVAREVATVQGQIAIAKSFPRDMDEVVRKIEAACSRRNLAQHALYTYARGGSSVQGASIRLAEALINAYGNSKAGFEVIDSTGDYTRVRSYAYDMENNSVHERTFDVPHVRYSKGNAVRLSDPRDIYETVANQASRRERACILAMIPADLVEFAVSKCQETMAKDIDITPDELAALQKAFASFGVSRAAIESRIQRKLASISADQFVELHSIYTSIADGVGKPEQFFDLEAKPVKEEKTGVSLGSADADLKASAGEEKSEEEADSMERILLGEEDSDFFDLP